MEIYWYISTQKVKMLKGASANSRLRDISIQLKALWFEVGASLKRDDSLIKDLTDVRKKLQSAGGITEFQQLSLSLILLSICQTSLGWASVM